MRIAPTRRAVLLGAACLPGLWLAGGCTGGQGPAAAVVTPPVPADPLLAVWQSRVDVLAGCDALLALTPPPATAVAVIRDQTAEQVSALAAALGGTPRSAAAAAPVSPDSGTVAGLRRLLDTSGARCATLCLTSPAERAPLLGSLAAAARCHSELLA